MDNSRPFTLSPYPTQSVTAQLDSHQLQFRSSLFVFGTRKVAAVAVVASGLLRAPGKAAGHLRPWTVPQYLAICLFVRSSSAAVR
jgi:hypothetical protein